MSRMSRVALVVCAAIVAAAGATYADASVATPAPPDSRHSGSLQTSGVTAARRVLVIVEENHSRQETLAGMPYLRSLALKYAYARHYAAITHPSLPNYLAIASGSTFGIRDDRNPSANAKKVGRAATVFDEAIAHGLTAKTYAESMPGNCAMRRSGAYVVKHNPWPYFSAGRSRCRRYDVPAGTPSRGQLSRDIARGRLPNVGLVVPNVNHDAHDGSLAAADHWLKLWVPRILRTHSFTSGRLAVVVTADESDTGRRGHNEVLTVVMHASSRRGRVVTRRLNHYSLSRLYSQVIGAAPLGHARSAADMSGPFQLG